MARYNILTIQYDKTSIKISLGIYTPLNLLSLDLCLFPRQQRPHVVLAPSLLLLGDIVVLLVLRRLDLGVGFVLSDCLNLILGNIFLHFQTSNE